MPLNLPSDPGRLHRLMSHALDLLYPPICAVCEVGLKNGGILCTSCDADLPRLTAPFCKICGEGFDGRIDGNFTCPNCSTLKFAFEFTRPATFRDERTLAMIHRLKYSREIHLAEALGRLAGDAFHDPRLAPALDGNWPLVPVPLYRKREAMRHFNQAIEISRVIAKHIGLPVLKALVRTRATNTQTALTRSQRLENLRGAFALSKHGKKILAEPQPGVVIIDDVFTTGSTVDECAKVLRKGGFQRVFVVTVMRG
jgi:competence protein ComFC